MPGRMHDRDSQLAPCGGARVRAQQRVWQTSNHRSAGASGEARARREEISERCRRGLEGQCKEFDVYSVTLNLSIS